MAEELEQLKAELEASRKEISRLNTPKPPEPSDLEKRLRSLFEPPKEESKESIAISLLKAELDEIKGINKGKLLEGLSEEDRAKIEPIVADMSPLKAKETVEAILGFKVVQPVGGLPAGSTGGTKEPGRYEKGYKHVKNPEHYQGGIIT